MTAPAAAERLHHHGPSFRLLVLLIGVLTVVRYIGLATTEVELMFDEAQYWSWSLEPAFGYFSKPPFIAWLIGAQNAVCGTSEFCARSAAPVLHMGTALVIYWLARRLVSPLCGFWSGLMFALLPGVSFSARLITTDVPLLLCWAVALWSLWGLRERRSWGLAVLLGVAIGIGLLAKYAMVYLLLCLVVYAIIDRAARRTLFWPGIGLAGLVALILLAPNILWNIDNGLITILHTADNVNWTPGNLVHPAEAAEFFGAQFGVFGPIPMALLVAVVFRPRLAAGIDAAALRFLWAFSVPVVTIIVLQALLSRAHANWAAPTYVAATVLVTAVMLARGWRTLLYATLAIHIAVQAVMLWADSRARDLTFPFGIDLYYRTLGFKEMADRVGAEFSAGGYTAVLTDWRRATATLLYNLRADPPPVVTWPHPERAFDHYQLTRPLTDETGGPLLLVTRCNKADRLDAAFNDWRLVDTFTTKGGPRYNWSWFLIAAAGPRFGDMPPPDCHLWEGDGSTIIDPGTLPPERER